MTAATHTDLLALLTAGRTLPDGCDRWGIRSVHPDLYSSRGYRWPWPGQWAQAPGPILPQSGECPQSPGDGICLAHTWAGMASGGISAITLLLCGWSTTDLLSPDAEKVRVSRAFVVDVVDGARLIRQHGHGAYLADANLHRANLARAYLADANLAGANLARANLAGANLDGADLADAYLAGANLARAYLAGANLAGANLARADLAGADLDGANLAGANLAGANLAGADLAGADLADAYLAGANLARANLAGANLAGANLAGANLADAVMT